MPLNCKYPFILSQKRNSIEKAISFPLTLSHATALQKSLTRAFAFGNLAVARWFSCFLLLYSDYQ